MSSVDLDPFEALRAAREPPPGAELSARIKQQCTEDLTPQRPVSVGQRLLVSGLAVATGVSALVLVKTNPAAFGDSEFAGALYGSLGWSLVLCCVLAIGLVGPPGRRASARLRWLVVALVPLGFLVYLSLYASKMLPAFDALEDAHTIGCGGLALACSATFTLGVLFPWRRTDPFNPGLTSALLGLVGGLAAGIALGIVCPNREAWHLWIGHGLGLLGAGVVAAWLGRRWLAP